jgi:hypothetical protein
VNIHAILESIQICRSQCQFARATFFSQGSGACTFLAVVTVVGVISLIDLRLLGVQSHHVSIRRLIRSCCRWLGCVPDRAGYRVAAFRVPSPGLLAETALPDRAAVAASGRSEHGSGGRRSVAVSYGSDSSTHDAGSRRTRPRGRAARAIYSQSSVGASPVARIYPVRSAWDR